MIGAIGTAILDRRWFATGRNVCQAGDQADAFWMILNGTALLSIGEEPGARVIKSAGSLYGDIECLLDIPYEGTLTVTSPEGLEAARLSPAKLKENISGAPKMVQAWVQLNALRVLKSGRQFHADAQALNECHSLIDGLEEMLDELLAEEPKN
ncbi:MAG: cyclic nucleotide-binding domain-containing protein [Alphaproteobacteria bacterium]|nr:cyclic nucleotide-binding domain-containing protein [Alphaproteobacteria bacterium SS10]